MLAEAHLKYTQLDITRFPVNRSEANCTGCRFRKICEQPIQQHSQTSLF